MKTRLTGIIALAIALALVGGIAVAQSSTKFNPMGTFPIVKERKSLTIGIQSSPMTIDYNKNDFTKFLSEKVGVNLNFITLPAQNANQKLALMAASGEKLPDVIIMPLTDLEVFQYGSQGTFIPLNKYYDGISQYIKARIQNDPIAKTLTPLFTSADGNIYTVPRYQQEAWQEWHFRYWINQTWLDKLSLRMPTTTDEYYQVLKAFKTRDPNGNGKADEIPLMGSTNGWGQAVIPYLMNAFVYTNADFDYLLNNNGTIEVAYNKPEWKAGLEYMQKLFAEGLLAPQSFTQDVNQFKAVLENKDFQLNGSIAAASMSVYQGASVRKPDMNLMAPLKGPKGVNYATFTKALPLNYYYVTKDCKDPDVAFMLADFMWNEETTMRSALGVPGVNYKPADADVKGNLSEMYPKAPVIQKIEEPGMWAWGQPGNVIWGDANPSYRSDASYQLAYNPASGPNWFGKVPLLYFGKAPKDPISKMVYTAEEAKQLVEIVTGLRSYVAESATAFIAGNKRFSEWDDYVKELDKIGLQKYLQLNQRTLNRMNKK